MPHKSNCAHVTFQEILDLPGYQFGDDGTAWTCLNSAGNLTSRWKQLKAYMAPGRNRLRINVRVAGRGVGMQLHVLILRAFAGQCPDNYLAAFLDGDTANVRLSNLQWMQRDHVRFWSRVKKSPGCWEWQGGRNPKGYGSLQSGKTSLRAHRVAYQLAVGPIPKNLFVLHRCDNPPCCRPDHLFLGTNQDNLRDMASKGRSTKGRIIPIEKRQSGESNPFAKLSQHQAIVIRERYFAGGVTMKVLGHEYGVSPSSIFDVVHGKTWNVRHAANDANDSH